MLSSALLVLVVEWVLVCFSCTIRGGFGSSSYLLKLLLERRIFKLKAFSGQNWFLKVNSFRVHRLPWVERDHKGHLVPSP